MIGGAAGRSGLGVLAAVCMLVCAGAALALPGADSVFGVYEQNRRLGRPNYITQDLLLVSYALIREQAWEETERSVLLPAMTALFTGLEQAAAGDAEDEPGLANREFTGLLVALIRDADEPPAGERARAEWQLVRDATGIARSPLFGTRVDYSQFRPRGRHAANAQQAAYFRAVRYAQTALFGVQPSAATGLDAATAERLAVQAARLAALLGEGGALAEAYRRIDTLLASRFGPADDLEVSDVLAVTAADAGGKAALAPRLATHAVEHGRLPRILGGVVDPLLLETGMTPARALSGWRLLAARYTPESEAMQGLVWDRVGQHRCSGECPKPFTLSVINGLPVKGMPNVLELPALLGSDLARTALRDGGDDRYEGYEAAWTQARDRLAAEVDGQGSAVGRLALLRAGFSDTAGNGPGAERLNAMLGFWVWQRRLDQLYTKQSHTLAGKSLELQPPPVRSGATLEHEALPLLRALIAFVDQEQAIDAHPARLAYRVLLAHCIKLAERVQNGESLPDGEQDFLNRLDEALLGLAGGGDFPIVVDLHTDAASGEVLELATGPARAILQGNATGARLSLYQFRQPLSERLDDAAWRERLRSGDISPAIQLGAGT